MLRMPQVPNPRGMGLIAVKYSGVKYLLWPFND